jgi:hypothetical protein
MSAPAMTMKKNPGGAGTRPGAEIFGSWIEGYV